MNTIQLSDGYNNNLVECDIEPIEKDGDIFKLQVHNSYLIRWCTRQEWEAVMWESYIDEAYRSLESETMENYAREEREAKYRAWLDEENKRTW